MRPIVVAEGPDRGQVVLPAQTGGPEVTQRDPPRVLNGRVAPGERDGGQVGDPVVAAGGGHQDLTTPGCPVVAIAGTVDGEPEDGLAIRWGITHLGRFSVAYRERFGESPSQTLA